MNTQKSNSGEIFSKIPPTIKIYNLYTYNIRV